MKKSKVVSLHEFKARGDEVFVEPPEDLTSISAPKEFKDTLDNMSDLELKNFIWMYDQYVSHLVQSDEWLEEQTECPGSILPCNIAEFYDAMYEPLSQITKDKEE